MKLKVSVSASFFGTFSAGAKNSKAFETNFSRMVVSWRHEKTSWSFQMWPGRLGIYTLPETNSSPLKIGHPKSKLVFPMKRIARVGGTREPMNPLSSSSIVSRGLPRSSVLSWSYGWALPTRLCATSFWWHWDTIKLRMFFGSLVVGCCLLAVGCLVGWVLLVLFLLLWLLVLVATRMGSQSIPMNLPTIYLQRGEHRNIFGHIFS